MSLERQNKAVLVLGGKGMLGTDLVALLRCAGSVRVESADIEEVDITDAASVERCLDAARPDVAINCAAVTDVDLCETQHDRAYAVNAGGPETLAKACAGRRIRLVHVSTDYVFDGRKSSPYLPGDPTNPINVYGRSKLAGERAVAAECPNHLIVRTAWLYGAHGENFVRTVLRLAQEKPTLPVVADQIGSPTYTVDLASILIKLAESDAVGITHATNGGSCSWYEFACEIVGLAGLPTAVEPIPTSGFPRPAPRPAYSVLDCSRTQRIAGINIRHWRDALCAFFAELQATASS